jgi:hypothetical protein
MDWILFISPKSSLSEIPFYIFARLWHYVVSEVGTKEDSPQKDYSLLIYQMSYPQMTQETHDRQAKGISLNT